MKVPFFKFNVILINAVIPEREIRSGYTFSLTEYIKSQVHCPILVDFDKSRDLKDYFKAYDILMGYSTAYEDQDSFKRVVEYFYKDILAVVKSQEKFGDIDKFIFYLECEPVSFIPYKTVKSGLTTRQKIEELEKMLNDSIKLIKLN